MHFIHSVFRHTTVFKLLLCGLLLLTGQSAGFARTAPYALRDTQHRDEADTISVYNTHTGRTLWRTSLLSPDFCWSPGHRVLFIYTGASIEQTYHTLLVWRAGRVKEIWNARLYKSDFVLGKCVWSADCRRVLFRVGGSGDGEYDLGALDVGTLYCLDTISGHIYSVSTGVRDMYWKGRRIVQYHTVRFYDRGTSTPNYVIWQPLTWHSP